MLLPQILAIVEDVLTTERNKYIRDTPKFQCLESASRIAPTLAARGINANVVSSNFLIDTWTVENGGLRRRVSWTITGHSWTYLPDYEVMLDCTGDQFNEFIVNENEHVPRILIAKPEHQLRYLFQPGRYHAQHAAKSGKVCPPAVGVPPTGIASL